MKIPAINNLFKQQIIEHVPGKVRVYKNKLGIGRNYFYTVTDLTKGTSVNLETIPDNIDVLTNSKGQISIIDYTPTLFGKEIGPSTWIETLKTETGKIRSRVKQGVFRNKIETLAAKVSI